ncbi:GNAT family N-acetyltransferase (plasmid) [Deinococcus sp. KNUC1210]|uniref:GNAT family N-acetyltransferase n=1 Tax=Deinococcus sp. KNUC1210 TaxID=2917691 RepID=UPI001EF0F399|nr:GNAT family N-acetyltransferase [Deinococcus sp. KNUC1210]ULH17644.1 GNAT family N-acetyltransferase [Deinococcus sp. KNUC1210]
MKNDIEIQINVLPDLTELAELHALAFNYQESRGEDYWKNVIAHSLCWLTIYREYRLIGFANVAWDGGMNAFLLDVAIHPEFARQGIGSSLVKRALVEAGLRGASWMHVDYQAHLQEFYLKCGFIKTRAGRQRL